MQASLVMFANAVLPVDPLQAELAAMLGTGYLAASITAWTLKACPHEDTRPDLRRLQCLQVAGASRTEHQQPSHHIIALIPVVFTVAC
jgi:hypothetical protein